MASAVVGRYSLPIDMVLTVLHAANYCGVLIVYEASSKNFGVSFNGANGTRAGREFVCKGADPF